MPVGRYKEQARMSNQNTKTRKTFSARVHFNAWEPRDKVHVVSPQVVGEPPEAQTGGSSEGKSVFSHPGSHRAIKHPERLSRATKATGSPLPKSVDKRYVALSRYVAPSRKPCKSNFPFSHSRPLRRHCVTSKPTPQPAQENPKSETRKPPETFTCYSQPPLLPLLGSRSNPAILPNILRHNQSESLLPLQCHSQPRP